MKKSLYIIVLVLLAVPAGLYITKYLGSDMDKLIKQTEQEPTAAGPVTKTWKTGQILVKPKSGLPQKEFDKILSANKGKSAEKIGNLPVHIISVPDHAEEAVVRALSRNPHIEFAELDMVAELSEATPNDPKFATQWHLPKIQSAGAWDVSKANGITIAILDTGVDSSHPDLADKIVPGINAVDGSSDTSDVFGHGTKVAGTAAAITNNASGVAGVAWLANIMPVRITNRTDGYAYWSDIARGMSWAADNGADVVNVSYETTGSSAISSAAQYLRSKGGLAVVAAGNSGVDIGLSDNPYIITVSATSSTDTKTSWSNYGAAVDVSAPGASILTTVPGGGYGSVSGTSFASPITAGVVGLIMGANPNLTPDDVENILESSADKVAGTDFHPYYGYGRVNAQAAVQMALSAVAADTQAPIVGIFSPTSNTVVSGLVQVDVSAVDNVGVASVSLYANGNVIGTDDTAPFQFSWDSANEVDGSVILTAIASDTAGNEGSSSTVSVNVQNQVSQKVSDQVAPTVAISEPFDGSTVSGLVTITAEANDDVAVAKVEVNIDGKLAGSTTSNLLRFKWNTRKVNNGNHTIEAIATDTSGNTNTTTIQVTK